MSAKELNEAVEWLRKLIGSPIWTDVGDEQSPHHLQVAVNALLDKRRPSPPQAFDPGLLPETADLVQRFAAALHEKLLHAQVKYGYDKAEWRRDDWEEICRHNLYEHLAKGDPRDVANYCAFMWHHGWSTALPSAPEPTPAYDLPLETTFDEGKPVDRARMRLDFEAAARALGEGPMFDPGHRECAEWFLDDAWKLWCAARGVTP